MVNKIRIRPLPLFIMLAHAYLFSHNWLPSQRHVEVMGLLGGRSRGTQVTVEEAFPISHGSLIETEMPTNAFKVFEIITPKLEEKGWWVVGWYHSHPGHGLFLSSLDQETQETFQHKNPKSIALVIEPHQLANNLEYIAGYQVEQENTLGKTEVKIPVTCQRPQIQDVLQYLRENPGVVQEFTKDYRLNLQKIIDE